ncbi:MAG: DegT/DnrJ/EryC1/StrS family aminotransferase [Thermodesulfobacteriota bacterium]|nr:DegT/DnrJ/EryC1/StrS family aminotransferase [Thermodesulfobacteriota bacterium]
MQKTIHKRKKQGEALQLKISIPLVDLKKQYQNIKDEIDVVIARVLQGTDFILGYQTEKLEQEVAGYYNTKYAVGVASGTDALTLSLIACGIGRGDEVITTPFTFVATAEAIFRAGAKPSFCDIDEKTYNLHPDKIREKITSSTRAILPVHLYGLACDMDRILSLAGEYNLKVIEDCAQAFGAEYKGNKVGSMGNAGCFSFFPGKNLGAYGDGGMVVTDEEEIANKIKVLRGHGSKNKYYYDIHGFNSRLDTLQAAILRVKLRHIDKWIRMRQENADYYGRLLSDSDIVVPFIPDYASHCFNYYTIRLKKDRNIVQKRLEEKGIAYAIYYPLSLHLQKVYEYLAYKPGDFPGAEKIQDEVISLPMYPELTREEIKKICKVLCP